MKHFHLRGNIMPWSTVRVVCSPVRVFGLQKKSIHECSLRNDRKTQESHETSMVEEKKGKDRKEQCELPIMTPTGIKGPLRPSFLHRGGQNGRRPSALPA